MLLLDEPFGMLDVLRASSYKGAARTVARFRITTLMVTALMSDLPQRRVVMMTGGPEAEWATSFASRLTSARAQSDYGRPRYDLREHLARSWRPFTPAPALIPNSSLADMAAEDLRKAFVALNGVNPRAERTATSNTHKQFIASVCSLSSLCALGLAGGSTPPETRQSSNFGRSDRPSFQSACASSFENNFDFNDSGDALTDDAWLLQRAPGDQTATGFLTFARRRAFEIVRQPNEPGVLERKATIHRPAPSLHRHRAEGSASAIGRQILSYGDERLIGSFDWHNLGRTFDAVKIRYAPAKDWFLDAFVSSVVVSDSDAFNHSDFRDGNDTDRDQIFSGLYFSSTALYPFGSTTDFYTVGLHEEYDAGDTDFVTLGSERASPVRADGFWTNGVQFGG
jgi:hypothetical protein